MYNIMARSRNRISVETQQCILCQICKYIAAAQCFYGKFTLTAECKLYEPVVERNYIQNNLHSFHTLHKTLQR
jgi:formate hydrogenlyase subunit 6/NADH:ubiquinone oxidoreductase subunit I